MMCMSQSTNRRPSFIASSRCALRAAESRGWGPAGRGAPTNYRAGWRDYIAPGVTVKPSGRHPATLWFARRPSRGWGPAGRGATLEQGGPMCVDNDSRPPIRPIAGGSAGSRDLTLTSSDGTRFMAHTARASKPTGAGMVVIPDVRGLHIYYKELADRFAEVGVDAVAIDFFARTASTEDRSDKFDFMSEVPKTKPETLQADIAAAAGYLRGKEGGQVRSLFSVGFCFGWALSYLQAASGLNYAGVIGFYGWPLGLKRWPDRPKPIDAVSRYASPVLSLFGGADEGIPQQDVDAFDTACKKANVKHDSTVYPGAPHSFFDRKYAEFKDASADAWKRVQTFVSQNTKR